MLATDEIKRLALKLQTTELNTRREYAQHEFLRFFYQQPNSDQVFFKGGTALRIVYQSPRFSEDLDFDSKLKISELEAIIEVTLVELQKDGVASEIVESKKTSGGYLGIMTLDGMKTSLEISNRRQAAGEIETIVGEFTAPYVLYSLEKTSLVGEKIAALKSRQKPRDFYDLYFMLRAKMLNLEQKKQLGEVVKIIEGTKINFERELEIFLPKAYWPVIGDFKQILLREIEREG
jgi:predicted nucleotidyltransferase component of viral defense system